MKKSVPFLILLFSLFLGCKKENNLPIVTTSIISDSTSISVATGGEVVSDGGLQVYLRGVVWSRNPTPTINLSSKTVDSLGKGVFKSIVTGLVPNTQYYIRAYATNSAGTSYGNEITFSTNSIPLSNGLLAFYPFNGNANDESGHNQNATSYGNPIFIDDRKGNLSSAVEFDGIDDFVLTPLKNIQNTLTYSAWINANPKFSEGSIICSRNILGDRWNGLLTRGFYSDSLGILSLVLSNADSSLPMERLMQIWDEKWHHIVATYDRSIRKIYIDGVLALHADLDNFSFFIDNNIAIGGSALLGILPYVGKIDDVAVFNRALSQDEVMLLYKN